MPTNNPVVRVTKVFTFDSCHHLPNYNGKCRNEHGHTYKLEITLEGEIDPETHMVLDFAELKSIVQEAVLEQLDHNNLNKFYPYPTAEEMVVDIFNKLSVNWFGSKLYRVALWETPTSFAEVVRQ